MTQDFVDMLLKAVNKDTGPVTGPSVGNNAKRRYHHLPPDMVVCVIKHGTADVLPVIGVSLAGELIIQLGKRAVPAWEDGHDGYNVLAGQREDVERTLRPLGYRQVVSVDYETWVNKRMIDSGVGVETYREVK